MSKHDASELPIGKYAGRQSEKEVQYQLSQLRGNENKSIELDGIDWRDTAKNLSKAIVGNPNLYGIYTIYDWIDKIVLLALQEQKQKFHNSLDEIVSFDDDNQKSNFIIDILNKIK